MIYIFIGKHRHSSLCLINLETYIAGNTSYVKDIFECSGMGWEGARVGGESKALEVGIPVTESLQLS